MNRSEAYDILARRLAELFDYHQLAARLNDNPFERVTLTGSSGREYLLQINLSWENRAQGKIRLSSSIVPVGAGKIEPMIQDLVVSKPSPSIS